MVNLLTTKFSVPPLRQPLTERPRLTKKLASIWQNQLTLVLAPAGFGKTTAVLAWLHQQPQHTQIGWLSLDSTDNEPNQLLNYLLGAFQAIQPTLPETVWDETHTAQQRLTQLVNHLHQQSQAMVFVFDDYHHLKQPAIQQMVQFLLEHAPPQLHLVIISRVEPPLALARLRTHDKLLTLGLAELRFNQTETNNFLKEVMGLPLSTDDITALAQRTEGWIAGLQLAALALQGHLGISSNFIANFGGSHRYILDYLADEVFHQQPPDIQQFLLTTSILERLTADLCGYLLPYQPLPNTPQQTLEYLEQANLFIIPLDDERRWYRYHALFAGFLRHRLKENQPERLIRLHQRAAAWCEQSGFMAEALYHALEAGDVARATRLIKQVAPRILSRSEISTLMSWLNALSDEIQTSRTRMSLFQAWALLVTGQIERVESRLAEVQQALDQAGLSALKQFSGAVPVATPAQPEQSETMDLQGEISAIRGTIAYVQRQVPQAIQLYRQAAGQLSPENSFLRGAVSLNLGLAYSWAGEIKKSSQALRHAYELNQTTDNLYVASIALWNLAELQLEQGQRHLAADSYQRIATLTAQPLNFGAEQPKHSFSLDAPLLPDLSGAYIGRGALLYEEDELERAERLLTTGLILARQATDSIMVMGYIYLARLKQAQGQGSEALALMHEASVVIYREKIADYWGRQAKCWLARLQLQQNQLESVSHWAQEAVVNLADFQKRLKNKRWHLRLDEYLTFARLLIAQRNFAEVISLLTDFYTVAESTGRLGRVIEISALQAVAYHQHGQKPEARQWLNRALSLAEPEGYVRLFVDMGVPLAVLLRTIDSHEATYSYAGQLLSHFGPDAKDPTIEPLLEPLSDRELEILRLVAEGMSNQKIADTLFLTTGTVKWHVSNIYGKLSVRKRTQAVARARALRLL